MFCPHCGKTTSTAHKFCRACGLSLEKVAQSLAEQLSDTELNKPFQDRERQVERWLSIILGTAFAVFVMAVIWALVYKIIITKGEVFEGLLFLGLFLALIAALLLVVYRESLREGSAKRKKEQLSLSPAETTGKLLPESKFEPVPTVTDRTTELLFAEKQGRKD